MILPIITLFVSLATIAITVTVVGFGVKKGVVNPIAKVQNKKRELAVRKVANKNEHDFKAEKNMLKKLYKNRLALAKIGYVSPSVASLDSKTFSSKKLSKQEKKYEIYNAKEKLAGLNKNVNKMQKYASLKENLINLKKTDTQYSYNEIKDVAGEKVDLNYNSIKCNTEISKNAFESIVNTKTTDKIYPRVVEIVDGSGKKLGMVKSTNNQAFETGTLHVLGEAYVKALDLEKQGKLVDFTLTDFNYGNSKGNKKNSMKVVYTHKCNSSDAIKKCIVKDYKYKEEEVSKVVNSIKSWQKSHDDSREINL